MYVPERIFDTVKREKKSDEKKNETYVMKLRYLSSSFLFSGDGGGVRKTYIAGTSQNHRTDMILRRIHNLRTRAI